VSYQLQIIFASASETLALAKALDHIRLRFIQSISKFDNLGKTESNNLSNENNPFKFKDLPIASTAVGHNANSVDDDKERCSVLKINPL